MAWGLYISWLVTHMPDLSSQTMSQLLANLHNKCIKWRFLLFPLPHLPFILNTRLFHAALGYRLPRPALQFLS